MDTNCSLRAIITWERDPSNIPKDVWLRDLIVNYGEIIGKTFTGDCWTVPVKVTGFIEGTWDTYADVRFLVEEAPWHLLVGGYCFKLWAGKEIATVRIL
ncbi:hypothetical protein P5G65_16055 [Paenibacillus chondroitinus]|uniref:Uncharacterized protein n=1 Tax=Paenibacillus chondroitinus TaxID=59842 RepID=A0ABU6DCD3_9BACL|nr:MULTISPECIES: hypothetical protein [Paenibacillus]MCY9659965.1 hypothetical protein [Paenibacillus anseongense]MEB4795417.1 hypothetical protein [Paenibacillus chondroitinus]